MFSFLLLSTEIIILENFKKNQQNKSIYFLPIISLLWANLHGGSSSLSYIVPLFYLFFSIREFKIGNIQKDLLSKEKLKKLAIICLLTILTICINPYGFKMLLYPYSNMLDTTMLASIVEWQSPNY